MPWLLPAGGPVYRLVARKVDDANGRRPLVDIVHDTFRAREVGPPRRACGRLPHSGGKERAMFDPSDFGMDGQAAEVIGPARASAARLPRRSPPPGRAWSSAISTLTAHVRWPTASWSRRTGAGSGLRRDTGRCTGCPRHHRAQARPTRCPLLRHVRPDAGKLAIARGASSPWSQATAAPLRAGAPGRGTQGAARSGRPGPRRVRAGRQPGRGATFTRILHSGAMMGHTRGGSIHVRSALPHPSRHR